MGITPQGVLVVTTNLLMDLGKLPKGPPISLRNNTTPITPHRHLPQRPPVKALNPVVSTLLPTKREAFPSFMVRNLGVEVPPDVTTQKASSGDVLEPFEAIPFGAEPL